MNILMNRFLIFSVIVSCCMMALTIGSVSSEPYKALNGVESVKVVFDIRVKTSQALAIHLDAIAAMIPALAENGIKLQVCMFAAGSYGVKADSILPGIEQVQNGWISSIGYQRQGYALISDF
ncbi:MAG: DsrE family protein [Proteobacteria bacterium]|nr:hypothetical protein [Desulfobacula sp.]MBU3954052.1 DsrE family protein [Pseudomonadota bacterium]MBU4133175.1 DsrE family protein [Pseudomonadota bacterium]